MGSLQLSTIAGSRRMGSLQLSTTAAPGRRCDHRGPRHPRRARASHRIRESNDRRVHGPPSIPEMSFAVNYWIVNEPFTDSEHSAAVQLPMLLQPAKERRIYIFRERQKHWQSALFARGNTSCATFASISAWSFFSDRLNTVEDLSIQSYFRKLRSSGKRYTEKPFSLLVAEARRQPKASRSEDYKPLAVWEAVGAIAYGPNIPT